VVIQTIKAVAVIAEAAAAAATISRTVAAATATAIVVAAVTMTIAAEAMPTEVADTETVVVAAEATSMEETAGLHLRTLVGAECTTGVETVVDRAKALVEGVVVSRWPARMSAASTVT
jgi:hypothetical protein